MSKPAAGNVKLLLLRRQSRETVDSALDDFVCSRKWNRREMMLAAEVMGLRDELKDARGSIERVLFECLRAAPPPRDPKKYILSVDTVLSALSDDR